MVNLKQAITHALEMNDDCTDQMDSIDGSINELQQEMQNKVIIQD